MTNASSSGSGIHGAREIASAVGAGEVGPLEAAEASRDALSREQQRLRTSITLVDKLMPPEVPNGPLSGVPVHVKDLIDTAGLRTTYGSALFAEHVPDSTAECVRRLQRAGAVVVGKANLHEFAWGLTSQNPHWGNVVNPHDPSRTPGGSSGGNAAAVAAGLVPIGIGTDTAGSIRVPAACCDVVGFKPSNDSVPTTGVFPLAPSLDCIGPITNTVDDCALVFSVLAGQSELVVDWQGLRVAATTETLRELLARVGIVASLVDAPVPPRECSAILPGEGWRTHRDLVAQHADQYGENALRKIRLAAEMDEACYEQGISAARRWRARVACERDYDVLVQMTLTMPVPGAGVDEIAIRQEFGRNARWVNVLRWAAASVGKVHVAGPDNWAVLTIARRVEQSRAEAMPHSLKPGTGRPRP